MSLDVIRGFALWGILLVNIVYFSSPYAYSLLLPDGGDRYRIDEGYLFVNVLAQGKFFTLFSLLFGFGFMLLFERARIREHRPKSFVFRRMFILLCFGIVHALFIWWGDILIVYALCGTLLIAYVRCSARTLVYWAIGLVLVLILLSFFSSSSETAEFVQSTQQQAELAVRTYASGAYADVLKQNRADWLFHTAPTIILSPLLILPLFLLGAALYRSGLWMTLYADRVLRNKWLVMSSAIGVPMTIVKHIASINDRSFESALSVGLVSGVMGDTSLAVCFALALVSFMQARSVARFVCVLRYAGRMALTNYVLQAVICGFIFYPYGLGSYGEVPVIGLVAIATFVFVVQVLYSRWWLQRWSMGPMEWVWRALTYGAKADHR